MPGSSGWGAKKPRLETATANKVVEDLWGEDLSLDAVEECVFQASQYYPELKQTEPVASQALPTPSQYFSSFLPPHNSTAIPSTSKQPDDPVSKGAYNKLEAEIKKLRDELQGKVGEISYLRSQKKVDDDKWNNQLLENTKMHTQRIRILEKESSLAQTTIELMQKDLWKATDLGRSLVSRKDPADVEPAEEGMVFSVGDADGELLEDMLSPHLFQRSEPEVYDSKSTGLSDPSLMEGCWPLVQRLCLEENFASCRAVGHVAAVFESCHAVIAALVHSIKVGGRSETLEDLQLRDRELVESTLPTPEDVQLLSGRRWFDGELGVDSRRALATLAALCSLSQRCAELVLATYQATADSNGLVAAASSGEKSQQSEYATCVTTLPRLGSVLDGALDNDRAGPGRSEQMGNVPPGLLELLRDLAHAVFSRRHALAYGGVLTAICTLVSAALSRTKITKQSGELVVETMRWVALSRPRIFVLPALLSVLSALSWTPALTEALCRPDTALACSLREDGVAVFTADTCVVEMLCWLAEQRDSSVANRTQMCLALVDWVWSSVKQRPQGATWSRAKATTEPADECQCRPRLAEVCVRAVHAALLDYELHFAGRLGEPLRKALVRGMMLLHFLTDTDVDFGRHMLHAEGSYQLLLIGLRETTHDLRLDEHEDESLRELLAMEEAIKRGHIEATPAVTGNLDQLCVSLKSCWANDAASMPAQ